MEGIVQPVEVLVLVDRVVVLLGAAGAMDLLLGVSVCGVGYVFNVHLDGFPDLQEATLMLRAVFLCEFQVCGDVGVNVPSSEDGPGGAVCILGVNVGVKLCGFNDVVQACGSMGVA